MLISVRMCGIDSVRHLTDVVRCVIVNWQYLGGLCCGGGGNANFSNNPNLQR